MSKLFELIAEHGARIAALEAELAACKQELAEARRTIERLNTPVELSTWQKMEQELAEARKEIACLTNEVDALHGSRDQVAEERDRLRADNSDLNEAITGALKDRDYFSGEVDKTKGELEQTRYSLQQIRAQQKEDFERAETLKSQLTTAQAEIEAWRKWEAGQRWQKP